MGAIQPGDHGGTYAGNPLACRAGAAVLRVIEAQGLVERAAVVGKDVLARLSRVREVAARRRSSARAGSAC